MRHVSKGQLKLSLLYCSSILVCRAGEKNIESGKLLSQKWREKKRDSSQAKESEREKKGELAIETGEGKRLFNILTFN